MRDTIIEVAADDLEDSWVEGVVHGRTPFALPAIFGYPAQGLVVKGAFEPSGFHTLEQPGQCPLETVW
jgi:hypothetical protein